MLVQARIKIQIDQTMKSFLLGSFVTPRVVSRAGHNGDSDFSNLPLCPACLPNANIVDRIALVGIVELAKSEACSLDGLLRYDVDA